MAAPVFISGLAAVAAIGGFFIGRHAATDAYVKKVAPIVANETTLETLWDGVHGSLDDPVNVRALAAIYGVPADDRARLEERLRQIPWVPPYRPAPFVGHMGRAYDSATLHVNAEGLRDVERDYNSKPAGTVRVFLTGGSTAWGSGSVQADTIANALERILNERIAPATRLRYEVINAAFPAWSTTQEKIFIQQRLVDMHPDVIIMFSGNNDVHWATQKADIRWFFSYSDLNFVTLLNELYLASGQPEERVVVPTTSAPADCADVGRRAARNIEEAARSAASVKSHLIFALQPNLVSTIKRPSEREQRYLSQQSKPYWDACYQAIRDEAAKIDSPNFQALDISALFGGYGADTELFIDTYHLAAKANLEVAQALASQLDWGRIRPAGDQASK
jgi:lysophospholipase L1-like esterase